MLLNARTVLVGASVVLVPYRAEHVERYHQWMSDPAVREATASEELTLEEEYEMQKLTFIVLRRRMDVLPSDPDFMAKHGVETMVGDVNIFLSQTYDSDSDSDAGDGGYGVAALQVFLPYASTALKLPPSSFFSKIGVKNEASISLFEKLGFSKVKVVEAFEEVEMGVLGGADDWGWEVAYEVLEVEPERQ
ncbi:hypothetical protein RQP46_005919 [Phenoliferia psychrophenolica]